MSHVRRVSLPPAVAARDGPPTLVQASLDEPGSGEARARRPERREGAAEQRDADGGGARGGLASPELAGRGRVSRGQYSAALRRTFERMEAFMDIVPRRVT